MMGELPSGMNGAADFQGRGGGRMEAGAAPDGEMPEGEAPDVEAPDGEMPDGEPIDGEAPENGAPAGDRGFGNGRTGQNLAGDQMEVGTPDAGTTQAAGSSVDSANYSTYEEMVEEYAADIAEIQAGDRYGNQIVDLYNPLNYIGNEETEDPAWVRIMMGAAEGDMSMFSSLNLQIAMLNAGIDANIEWQWDGGHVPSEIFSESFSLYVDQMYGEYVSGIAAETPQAESQRENGTAEEATGANLSGWVDDTDITNVSFTLADAVAYRTAGASKAIPGFDVIDYGQEDYVFGSREKDARHWNTYLLDIFEEYRDVLEPLFNRNE